MREAEGRPRPVRSGHSAGGGGGGGIVSLGAVIACSPRSPRVRLRSSLAVAVVLCFLQRPRASDKS